MLRPFIASKPQRLRNLRVLYTHESGASHTVCTGLTQLPNTQHNMPRDQQTDSFNAPIAGRESPSAPGAAQARYRYGGAFASVAIAWGIGMLTQSVFAPANLVMIFLLSVVASAYWLGRGPAIFAAVLGVAVFDFFFVPPKWSFAVADTQYVVTFAVMLLTGLAITELASRLRQAGDDAQRRERQTQDLYRFAQALSGAPSQAFVIAAARAYFDRVHHAPVTLLLPDESGVLRVARDENALAGPDASSTTSNSYWDTNIARAVFSTAPDEDGRHPGVRSDGSLYLALRAPMRTRGVLVVASRPAALRFPANDQHVNDDSDLATAAALLALSLERIHLVEIAHLATRDMENERLRNTLLSALSHDLRTPLTAILGSADALRLHRDTLGEECLSLAEAISQEARRTTGLVENILDMARLESGSVSIDFQWHSLEEVASAAAASRESILLRREVAINFGDDFPLISCDAVLMERVFVNLIENAAKFSPDASPIEIQGKQIADEITVSVRDHGKGIAPGSEEKIFRKFVRGEAVRSTPGLGLGLAICKAIVEAHRGRINATNHAEGGTVIRITLPLGSAPAPTPFPAEST